MNQYLYHSIFLYANKDTGNHMIRSLPPVTVLAFLLVLCLCSACVSPFASPAPTPVATPEVNISLPITTPVPDIGIRSLERPLDHSPIGFTEAWSELLRSEGYSFDIYQNKPKILFVQATGLDGAGNAGRWLFGINKGNTYELRVYDRSGWSTIPWDKTIAGEEINLSTVLPPGILVNDSISRFHDLTWPQQDDQPDIELRNGTYTFTVSLQGTSQTLVFNATTGEAVESHEG